STCCTSTARIARRTSRPNSCGACPAWCARSSDEEERLRRIGDQRPPSRPHPPRRGGAQPGDGGAARGREGGATAAGQVSGRVRPDDRRERRHPAELGAGAAPARRAGAGVAEGGGGEPGGGGGGAGRLAGWPPYSPF